MSPRERWWVLPLALARASVSHAILVPAVAILLTAGRLLAEYQDYKARESRP